MNKIPFLKKKKVEGLLNKIIKIKIIILFLKKKAEKLKLMIQIQMLLKNTL
jgi:hypothetical protein